MRNCQYNVEIKNEWVQWVTGSEKRTSLKSVTQAEAKKIIRQQEGIAEPTANQTEDNWAVFSTANKQHLTLMSQMRTAQWITKHPKHGEVADMPRLSSFLKSNKSPIKKPLQKMDPSEVSKIIECFKSMVTKIYK